MKRLLAFDDQYGYGGGTRGAKFCEAVGLLAEVHDLNVNFS